MLSVEEKEKLYEEVKHLTAFSQEDAANLASVQGSMGKHAESLSDYFYSHLHRVEKTKDILNEEEGRTERLKKTLMQWFENLFSGNYDMNYANDILRIGSVHVVKKIDQKYVLSMYGMVFKFINTIIEKEFPNDPEKVEKVTNSVGKILAVDMALMMETYIEGLVDSTGWSMTLLKNMASQSVGLRMQNESDN
ncbi:MAG: protoglobin domain-containing protein [Cyanobacteria bacterium J06636_16]